MKGNLQEYLKTYKPRENETIKNGMLYCTLCNDKKIYVHTNKEFYHCTCKCQQERYKQQEEQKQQEKQMRYLQTLKNDSLLYNKYKEFDFEKFDLDRPENIVNAFKFCKEYCEQIAENVIKGTSIYLYGENNGTGKTRLSVCIANYALNKYIPTLFTSMYEILRTIKAIYDKQNNLNEDAYIQKISNIDLLVLDDFGAELKNKNNDFFNEIVFQILDKRLKNNKATIFTSNYGLKELIAKGFTRRNAERILEMCLNNFIKLTGSSYRLKLLKNAQNGTK